MAKHFERQGKSPYAYHAVSFMMLVIESTSPHLYIQYCVWEFNSLLHWYIVQFLQIDHHEWLLQDWSLINMH